MKKRKTTKPEAILHESLMAAGYVTRKAFEEGFASARPTSAETKAVLKANPFRSKFKYPSHQTLSIIDQLRKKISTGVSSGSEATTDNGNPPLPIDPLGIAEHYEGIVVVPCFGVESEFECMIEFNASIDKFVMFHFVDQSGKIPQSLRRSCARHLAHFHLSKANLKTGVVPNTTHLDADPVEWGKANELATEILVPTELLRRDLEALASKYRVTVSDIYNQASRSKPKSEPSPKAWKPGAITPLADFRAQKSV